MAETALRDDELWEEFHRVVNMSSQELAEWLRIRSSSLHAQSLPGQPDILDQSNTPDQADNPEQADMPIGQRVLHILGKRQAELSPDDLQVMRKVVRRVHAGRRGHGELLAGRTGWRHRLMLLGHDPLKPV